MATTSAPVQPVSQRPVPPLAASKRPWTRRALQLLRELPLIPVLILLIVVGGTMNPFFLTADNIINVVSQSAVLGVVVVAQTLVLLAKRIDLSVESVVTLAPLVAAWMMVPVDRGGAGLGLNPFLGLLVGLAVGFAVGWINAFFVVRVSLNPFVVTIAMLILLRGLAQGVAQGKTMSSLPDAFTYLGSARWFGVPVAVWLTGAIFLAAGLFLRYHRIGRAIYAIGGNETAARAAGIRVNRIVAGTFIVAGLLSALAGIMLAGRLATASATQGTNLIFSVLAACVIGGISLNGGRGRLLGALCGVLLLAVVQNLLTLSGIASYWIDATYGAIILVALILARVTGGKEKS